MRFPIEETSDVLGLGFESLICSMTLNHVILELSFICITVRESLLAKPMSQALFERTFILATVFELEYAVFHLIIIPLPLENLPIRM
jgi:hypothetical protein